jgi:hypothetical protein
MTEAERDLIAEMNARIERLERLLQEMVDRDRCRLDFAPEWARPDMATPKPKPDIALLYPKRPDEV